MSVCVGGCVGVEFLNEIAFLIFLSQIPVAMFVCFVKHFDTKIYFYYHLHWGDESLGQNSLKTLPNVSETVKPVSIHILFNFQSLHLLYFWTLILYHRKEGIYRFFFSFDISVL